jgi:hypothetical protein
MEDQTEYNDRKIRDSVTLSRSSQLALKVLYNSKIRSVAESVGERQIEVLLHQIVQHSSLTDTERSDLLRAVGVHDLNADTIVNLHDDLYGDLRDLFGDS